VGQRQGGAVLQGCLLGFGGGVSQGVENRGGIPRRCFLKKSAKALKHKGFLDIYSSRGHTQTGTFL
jgi:hypothetical protein